MVGKGTGFVNACMHIKPARNCEESLKSVLSCKPVQRENEVGVCVRKRSCILGSFFSQLEVQSLQLRLNDHETESAEAEGLRS